MFIQNCLPMPFLQMPAIRCGPFGLYLDRRRQAVDGRDEDVYSFRGSLRRGGGYEPLCNKTIEHVVFADVTYLSDTSHLPLLPLTSTHPPNTRRHHGRRAPS